MQEISESVKEDKFIVFGKPDISKREIEAVESVLKSGWLSTGEIARQFEDEFRIYLDVKHAVAVNSCTSGLILALMACDIGPGDEVITSPMTFCATVNAILAVGAKPVFVDVDYKGLIRTDLIRKAITKSTKAILPVHYTGFPCDMDKIEDIANEHVLYIIEDSAHAFGGNYYDGRKIGCKRNFSVFSFYPTKNITTGEGGMVLTNDKGMEERVRCLSMNGLSENAWKRYGKTEARYYSVEYAGIKGNMSDINAAIGREQLKRWSWIQSARKKIWEIYEGEFGYKGISHSMHLFTVMMANRDFSRNYLYQKGIGTGIHFKPLHLEPAYRFLGYFRGDFPSAEHIGEHTLSLPVSSTMTDEDAYRVVMAVKESGEYIDV